MGLHFGFKHKDGRLCPLSGNGRGLLSGLYCFSYTNWGEIWVPSRRAISNGTNICHVLILSTGRNLCVREWSAWIFKNYLYMDSYPSTQTYIYFSLKGGKVKKKPGIIAMQRRSWQWSCVCLWKFFGCFGIVVPEHPALKLRKWTCAVEKTHLEVTRKSSLHVLRGCCASCNYFTSLNSSFTEKLTFTSTGLPCYY